MKRIILAMAMFLSFATYASTVTGTINDTFCGEMDPYVIGDACILFVTDAQTGNKIGLVYDDYDWANEHVGWNGKMEDVIGKEFTAESCNTYKTYAEIRELKDYNSDYFYLSCNIFGFSFN